MVQEVLWRPYCVRSGANEQRRRITLPRGAGPSWASQRQAVNAYTKARALVLVKGPPMQLLSGGFRLSFTPTMIHQDSTSWQAIVEISGQWDKILGDVHRLEERSSQASSHDLTPPPNLNLMQYVPDIQSELEVCDNQMRERVETFARIFRENLERTSQEIQQAFEASWCQVRGEDISKNQTQEALIKLFQKQFAGEVQERKTIAIRALTRPHLAYQVQEEMENASGAEWTDETRALMERVYQQHPKLEAHEKKVLSEVSGLSLRQISIWVSSCSAFSSRCAPTRSSLLISYGLLSSCPCTG